MQRRHSNLRRALMVMVPVAMAPLDAFAYLDPGTGSFIIQALIAAFAVAALTARHYWYKLTSFLRDPLGRKREQEQQEDPTRDDES